MVQQKPRSLYQQHVSQWKNCRQCLLCEHRNRVVIARGQVPSKILFIGEAPGDSEDIVGRPFVGPAGRLLDSIIKKSVGEHSWAMTNLVCCIPKDASNSKGEPPKEAILACRPRLVEFIQLCRPKLIVCVGTLSNRNVPPDLCGSPRILPIIHPAAILRMDVSQQSLAIKRCTVLISDAVQDYL